MANDLNRHECIGNLGQPPEIRYMPNGKAVANFSVACNESWTDKNGVKQGGTEWIRYVAYDKLAEIIGEYLTTGSKVYVSGKLKTRKWADAHGVEKYTTEIICDQMQMLGGTKAADQATPQAKGKPTPAQPANNQPPSDFDSFDDDIPF